MLRTLKIRSRLSLAFLVVIALLIFSGVMAVSSMKAIRANAETVESDVLPSVTSLGEMTTNLMRVRVFTLRLLNTDDKAMQAETRADLEKIKREADQSTSIYEKLISSSSERALFESLQKVETRYYDLQNQVITLFMAGDKLSVDKLVPEMNDRADEMVRMLSELREINQQVARNVRVNSAEEYKKSVFLIVVIISVATIFAGFVAFALSNSINKPLLEAVNSAEVISKGDLTQSIIIQGDDELTRLGRALAAMQDNLKNAIVHIGNSSSQLASAAEELSSVTESSTKGLTLQNEEIQEAAAAISEMSSAIDEVSRRAQKASEDSADSAKLAGEGKAKVNETTSVIVEMNEGMITSTRVINQLAEQVASIGQILDVIRAVAEQTNLLALNAAIEAARAGETGRGFAVVADEVRNLAHRTQESTGEIETMVRQVQISANEAVDSMVTTSEKTAHAQSVADQAAKAFEQITARIVSISDSNHVIASAAEQQSNAAKDIDGNITIISDLASQTVVGANQTSASTAELTRLAIELNELVVKFKV